MYMHYIFIYQTPLESGGNVFSFLDIGCNEGFISFYELRSISTYLLGDLTVEVLSLIREALPSNVIIKVLGNLIFYNKKRYNLLIIRH